MSSSDQKRQLCQSIVKFLSDEIKASQSDSDRVEGLEVAKQCLETAFSISSSDCESAPDLFTTFTKGLSGAAAATTAPTEQNRLMAENLKVQGNQCMKDEKFEEAVSCYSAAIKFDPSNAVYLCNRAAAYSKLNNHTECIIDCKKALEIDPQHSKAYGRMGVAYSSLHDQQKAIECYKKALEIDPENASAKQNLLVAESKLAQGGGAGGLPAGIDMGALQNVASTLMRDPNMQNMFSSFMNTALFNNPQAQQSAEATVENAASAPPEPNLQNLFGLGQQLLGNMQRENPEMIQNLLGNIGRANNAGAAADSPKPDGPNKQPDSSS